MREKRQVVKVLDTYLITGGAGFIGSHLIDLLLSKKQPQVRVINLDNLSYAGTRPYPENHVNENNYRFIKADICDSAAVEEIFARYKPVKVIHLAAESHVDRSIIDPLIFVRTNVTGTQILLEAARRFATELFLQVSTDEVYGASTLDHPCSETSPLNPSSPYAASKAAADLLVQAYQRTYQLPVIISRCTNNYGPRQFPEKLIPLVIAHALHGKPIPVYGDGQQRRDWLYVDDHCQALEKILQYGKIGAIYNIAGHCHLPNLDVIRLILGEMEEQLEPHDPCRKNLSQRLITRVADRPGHDRCYSLATARIKKEIDWQPRVALAEGVRATVSWYLQNRSWLEQASNQSGESKEWQGMGNIISGGANSQTNEVNE
ncbi:MAG TPA: dTDP-glucose 4,6-dehydratase [Syntrophomonas sp.]|nr:dTDP-glucose 4,6-dehydratase [Syntrophomonas sp.]